MEIIDGTKPRAAKTVAQPLPDFRKMSILEKDKWANQELEKYILGTTADGTKVLSQSDYREGLTGFQYFVLNSGIKFVSPKGKLGMPLWRHDDEELIFHPLEYCDKLIARGKGEYSDFAIVKRRRFGLSTLFMGAYPLYNLVVNPGSVYGVTSADWRRIREGFNNKLKPMWDNWNSPLKPIALSKTDSISIGQAAANLRVTYPVGDDGEVRMGYVEGIETAKNHKNMEGYTMLKAFLDEIALHPNPSGVRNSTNAALSDDLFREGYMIMGGTVGDMTPEGAKELRNLIIPSRQVVDGKETDTADEHLIFSLVFGYHSVKQFTVNGWTDHEGAKEWILKERETLRKSGKLDALAKFMTDYPLTVEEMFDVSGHCSLPVQLKSPWKQRHSIITAKQPVGAFGFLDRKEDHIKFIPSNEGNIWLLEQPITGHEYHFGTDPIPFNEANEDGSENAIIVRDKTDNWRIKGYYCERSADPDLIADNCINLQDYFFSGLNMIEKNQGGVLIHKYRDRNRLDLLAKKPKKLGENQKFGDVRDSYGWQKANNAEFAYSLMVSEWNKHIHDIECMRYLEEMRGWLKTNHDLLDADVSLMILREDMRQKEAKAKEEEPSDIMGLTVVWEGNKLVRKWQRMPMKQGHIGPYGNVIPR